MLTAAVERTKATARTALEAFLPKSTNAARLVDALTADAERERLDRRKTLAEENAETVEAELAAIREHEPRRVAAKADIDRLGEQLEAANQAMVRLMAEHRAAIWPLQHRRDRNNNELRQTASPLIAAFLDELRELMRATYHARDHVVERMISGRNAVVWANHSSIERRSEAIHEAIRAVEILALEPLDDPTLEQHFDDIRSSLPAIEPRPSKYRQGGDDAA